MLEDYFYKDIPDLTTDAEMFALKVISDSLLSEGKFIDLLASAERKELDTNWKEFTQSGIADNSSHYPGGAYGIKASLIKGQGDYAWHDNQKKVPMELMKRYNAVGAQFLYIPPFVEVPKHIDMRLRACSISFPLTDNNTPTYFYETLDADKPSYVCQYDKPVLLNIQKPHSIKNNDAHRMVFQLSFVEPYETVRENILKIYDPRKCSI